MIEIELTEHAKESIRGSTYSWPIISALSELAYSAGTSSGAQTSGNLNFRMRLDLPSPIISTIQFTDLYDQSRNYSDSTVVKYTRTPHGLSMNVDWSWLEKVFRPTANYRLRGIALFERLLAQLLPTEWKHGLTHGIQSRVVSWDDFEDTVRTMPWIRQTEDLIYSSESLIFSSLAAVNNLRSLIDFFETPQKQDLELSEFRDKQHRAALLSVFGLTQPYPDFEHTLAWEEGGTIKLSIAEDEAPCTKFGRVLEYWLKSFTMYGDPFSPRLLGIYATEWPDPVPTPRQIFEELFWIERQNARLKIKPSKPLSARLHELEAFRVYIESVCLTYWNRQTNP